MDMERIIGPVHGFWIACSARRNTEDGLYTAYAKVCLRRPDSYWEAHPLVKLFGGAHHRTANAALITAASLTRFQLRGLLPNLPGESASVLDELLRLVFPLAAAIRRRLAALVA